MSKTKWFQSSTDVEGRTAAGQLVRFSCAPEDREKVVALLGAVQTLEIPVTGQANVGHGGHGRYTRYDVTQHKYAGGRSGYIEVLTIADPPDGRHAIVIYESGSRGASFSEWESLDDALSAFERCWASHPTKEDFQALAGFRRYVNCGALTPWFYVVGEEQLLGDYALPSGLEDDPVFRLGRQFVVEDEDGVPAVKTCLGSRYFEQESRAGWYNSSSPRTLRCRIVYWSDGTCWQDGFDNQRKTPRPLDGGELWITEALAEFRLVLGGKRAEFTIPFTNGTKFVGKVVRAQQKNPSAEGDYCLLIHLVGKSPVEGWVRGFNPTPNDPDIVQYVTRRYEKKGERVERIEILESQAKAGGKKWAGVFFRPPDQ